MVDGSDKCWLAAVWMRFVRFMLSIRSMLSMLVTQPDCLVSGVMPLPQFTHPHNYRLFGA